MTCCRCHGGGRRGPTGPTVSWATVGLGAGAVHRYQLIVSVVSSCRLSSGVRWDRFVGAAQRPLRFQVVSAADCNRLPRRLTERESSPICLVRVCKRSRSLHPIRHSLRDDEGFCSSTEVPILECSCTES